MRVPMAPDSRRLKPISLAVIPHPRNLVKNETTQMRIVYPQVTPLFRRPKLVRRPERAKYYGQMSTSRQSTMIGAYQRK